MKQHHSSPRLLLPLLPLLLQSLAITVSLHTTIARAATTTCFDTWGTENADMVPCGTSDNPSKPVSCCNKGDYCLSNGLCLSTGVNNLMTQQGCTDKNWSEPCNRICGVESLSNQTSSDSKRTRRAESPARVERELNERNDLDDDRDVGIALLPCVSSWDGQGGAVRYCCGNDAVLACCQSSKGMSIPAATIVRGAVDPARTGDPFAATGAESITTSTPAGGQQTSPLSPPSTTGDNNSAASETESSALRIGVGVGLGIGIPILIMLIVMVVLLVRQYNRQSKHAELAEALGGGRGGPRTMTPFRMVDTARSSTVGSLRRNMSTRTTRAGPPMEDWPPSNMDHNAWAVAGGSPSSMISSDRGVLLSPVPPLQRPLSPTPLAEMDGGDSGTVNTDPGRDLERLVMRTVPVGVVGTVGGSVVGSSSSPTKAKVEQAELPFGG